MRRAASGERLSAQGHRRNRGLRCRGTRVVTHPRVLRRPWSAQAATGFLEARWSSLGLSVLVPADRHRAVLGDVLREVPVLAGNRWHDAETANLMHEPGIRRFCTRDTDFHRFSFVEAIDPMVSTP